MKYWYQRPSELLSDVVRTVVVMEGFSSMDSSDLPLVTSAMPALLFSLTNDKMELKLFGQSVPSDYWAMSRDKTIVAWFFKPFAMAPLFNIPASRLKKESIDLSTWSHEKVNALKMQLEYATQTSQRVEVLEHFLTHQAALNGKTCEMVRYATDQMMYNPTPEILSTLLEDLKLNERTFQRMFKKYVGITPSQYRRICQFHLSFLQVRTREFTTLSEVAYDNGFSDQSHFIRSFKEFADTTPQSYIREGLKEKI